VIMLVAYNLVDVAHIKKILTSSKAESSVLLITFFSTLFLELEFAIYLGVMMSLILFLAKTSTPEITEMSLNLEQRRFVESGTYGVLQCPQLKVLRVDMSIYFGSVNHIQNKVENVLAEGQVNQILILCGGINFIDLSGTDLLINLDRKLKAQGGGIYFFAMKQSVKQRAFKLGLNSAISKDQFFDSKKEAIKAIFPTLNQAVCQTCTQHVFKECEQVERLLDIQSTSSHQ